MELHDCRCQLWSAVRLMSTVNQRAQRGPGVHRDCWVNASCVIKAAFESSAALLPSSPHRPASLPESRSQMRFISCRPIQNGRRQKKKPKTQNFSSSASLRSALPLILISPCKRKTSCHVFDILALEETLKTLQCLFAFIHIPLFSNDINTPNERLKLSILN